MVLNELNTKIKDYLDYEGIEHVGDKYLCINPAHKETVPSLKVYEDHAYCFGCNTYFDTVKAYMVLHNTDRETAIRALCEIFKIDPPVSKQEIYEAKHVMYKLINELSTVKYSQQTIDYLHSKGITLPQARMYGVLQYSREVFDKIASEHRDIYDKLGLDVIDTDGFLYTIYDTDSTPIAFVARNFHKEPKFVNPRNSILYNKSSELYGQHLIKSQSAIIVEGYSDALSAWAHGMTNVLALGGTRLNDNTIRRLKSLGIQNIALCLDGDDTGRKCMLDAFEKLSKHDFALYGAILEDGLDPDMYFKSGKKLDIQPAYIVVWKLSFDLSKAVEYVTPENVKSAAKKLAQVSGFSEHEIGLRIANALYTRCRKYREEVENAKLALKKLERYKEALEFVAADTEFTAIMDINI